MKIIKVTYRICRDNEVYIVHHLENGKEIKTLMKKCNNEEEAFEYIRRCMK